MISAIYFTGLVLFALYLRTKMEDILVKLAEEGVQEYHLMLFDFNRNDFCFCMAIFWPIIVPFILPNKIIRLIKHN